MPLLLGVLFAFSFLPNALYPVLEHDDNVYHLWLPKIYHQDHSLTYLPVNLWANMPHLIEVLYSYAMGSGDFVAAKVLSFSFVFVIIAGIVAAVRPSLGRLGAGLAVLLFVSGPCVVQWQLGLAYVEIILGALLLAGFVALIASRESSNQGYLWVLGLCCGSALASKYTGWLYGAAIITTAWWSYSVCLVGGGTYGVWPSWCS